MPESQMSRNIDNNGENSDIEPEKQQELCRKKINDFFRSPFYEDRGEGEKSYQKHGYIRAWLEPVVSAILASKNLLGARENATHVYEILSEYKKSIRIWQSDSDENHALQFYQEMVEQSMKEIDTLLDREFSPQSSETMSDNEKSEKRFVAGTILKAVGMDYARAKKDEWVANPYGRKEMGEWDRKKQARNDPSPVTAGRIDTVAYVTDLTNVLRQLVHDVTRVVKNLKLEQKIITQKEWEDFEVVHLNEVDGGTYGTYSPSKRYVRVCLATDSEIEESSSEELDKNLRDSARLVKKKFEELHLPIQWQTGDLENTGDGFYIEGEWGEKDDEQVKKILFSLWRKYEDKAYRDHYEIKK